MSDEEDTKDLLPDKPVDNQNINAMRQPTMQSRWNIFHYLCMCILSCIVGLLFGYEAGLGINNLAEIKNTISLDCSEQNAIISSWIIGALLSCIIGGSLVDRFGPRTVLSFTSSLLFSCSLMASLTDSFVVFLSSRILAGFGGSLLLIAQYIHVMETIVTKKYQLILFISMFSTISYLCLIFMNFAGISWRTEFGISSILACVTFIILLLLPPSVNQLNSLHLNTKNNTPLLSSKIVQTILFAITLTICCELMGHTTVRYYSPVILGMFGVCTEYQQNMAIIILNNLRVISTVILMFTIDKIGRRCSVILGTLIMAVTLILLGIFSLNDVYNNSINIQDLKDSSWINEQTNSVENCHRVVIGTDISYIIEPTSFIKNTRKPSQSPLKEVKTPYPFLPTPLAMTAETETANSIDFLFDCKHNNGPWSDDSLPSKATKLILIFLYESGNALAASFMYWIIFCDVAPKFIRGRLMGIMMGIHWLSSLLVQNIFINFITAFTLSGVFFLHSIACLIGLFISFLFLPEDYVSLNDKKFYFHAMLNNLRSIPGFGTKPKIADVKLTESTAI